MSHPPRLHLTTIGMLTLSLPLLELVVQEPQAQRQHNEHHQHGQHKCNPHIADEATVLLIGHAVRAIRLQRCLAAEREALQLVEDQRQIVRQTGRTPVRRRRRRWRDAVVADGVRVGRQTEAMQLLEHRQLLRVNQIGGAGWQKVGFIVADDAIEAAAKVGTTIVRPIKVIHCRARLCVCVC